MKGVGPTSLIITSASVGLMMRRKKSMRRRAAIEGDMRELDV